MPLPRVTAQNRRQLSERRIRNDHRLETKLHGKNVLKSVIEDIGDLVCRKLSRKNCLIIVALCMLVIFPHLLDILSWKNANAEQILRSLREENQTTICTAPHVKQREFQHYPGNGLSRPRESDYIGVLNFKNLAEVSYLTSRYRQPEKFMVPELNQFNVNCLKNGAIVLTDAQSVGEFISSICPLLKVKVVILTTDLDESMLFDSYLKYLDENSNVLAWFSVNFNLFSTAKSNRFYQIPLGLSQWDGQMEGMLAFHSNFEGTFTNAGFPISSKLLQSHEPTLFAAFALDTSLRMNIWNKMCIDKSNPINKHLTCFRKSAFANQDITEYYKTVSQFHFGISPFGNGMDCYRTWEMLYLGVYPIVFTSFLDDLYKDLPVLIVSSIEDITPNLLKSKLKEFDSLMSKEGGEGFRRMYMGHWISLIHASTVVTH